MYLGKNEENRFAVNGKTGAFLPYHLSNFYPSEENKIEIHYPSSTPQSTLIRFVFYSISS